MRAFIDANGIIIDENIFYERYIKPLEDSNHEFEKELNKMMELGLSEIQAGCYISNYHDDYICDTYNGGCKNIDCCKKIFETMKKEKDKYE